MLCKTYGIVLKNFIFQDNKRIVSIFTKNFGKKSFIAYNSRKSNFNIFQPLTLVNFEFNDNRRHNLHSLSNATIYFPFATIHSNIQKTSVAFFIAEFLDKTIENDFSDDYLVDFVVKSLIYFDQANFNPNFHISFLIDLLHFFGIMPFFNYSEQNSYFDIRQSQFTDVYNPDYCIDEILSYKFYKIAKLGIKNSQLLPLNKGERNILLSKFIDYYSFHYKPIGNINSSKVLTQIF